MQRSKSFRMCECRWPFLFGGVIERGEIFSGALHASLAAPQSIPAPVMISSHLARPLYIWKVRLLCCGWILNPNNEKYLEETGIYLVASSIGRGRQLASLFEFDP